MKLCFLFLLSAVHLKNIVPASILKKTIQKGAL